MADRRVFGGSARSPSAKDRGVGRETSVIDALRQQDEEIARALQAELERQRNTLELIASENFTTLEVLAAQGSVLTNKYAEGLPGDRYYAGCGYIDVVESIARERAMKLFGAEHANVQPHSGSQANMAVYLAMLSPGDPVVGLDLAHGGHLTHGSKGNSSGKLYQFAAYGVDPDTEVLDYDRIRELAREVRPKMIVAGASAYPRYIDWEAFADICREVQAYLLVDMAHIAGLVAAGVHPSPVPHADFVTGTTHKTLRGPRSGFILCKADYAKPIDKAVFPGIQGGPMMHEIAAKAVSFGNAAKEDFKIYQRQIQANARRLATEMSDRGYRLVSGGTDNHLLLVDLRARGVTGRDAQDALENVGIVVNKNGIPFDTQPPVVTSGIRLGTPAVTSRGMGEEEMVEIAAMVHEVLSNHLDEAVAVTIREHVREICDRFPLYPELKYW